MRWIETSKQNHNFYNFNINNHCTEVQWAKHTAYFKTKNTHDSWQKRTICKKFTNLFLGDLAKNLFKTYLMILRPYYFKDNIVEYDLIRTDTFKNPDKFDLKIVKGNKECTIEVKSSGEKYSSNPNNLLNRRIIINFGNEHQHFECMAVQILFVPTNLDFFQNEDYPDCKNSNNEYFDKFVNNYINQFHQQNIQAYIVGCADKEMQEKAVSELIKIQNQNANAEQRSYADLQVSNSYSLDNFLNSLDNFMETL